MDFTLRLGARGRHIVDIDLKDQAVTDEQKVELYHALCEIFGLKELGGEVSPLACKGRIVIGVAGSEPKSEGRK